MRAGTRPARTLLSARETITYLATRSRWRTITDKAVCSAISVPTITLLSSDTT